MPAPSLITSDPSPQRRVAVALELWDPVTLLLVVRGITPRLEGRDDKPILNRSGRFVWLGRETEWPKSLSVDPGSLPFEPIDETDLTPLKPAGWPQVGPSDRLIRIQLTPTPAYPLAGSATGVRGDLYEKDAADPRKRIPLTDAQVWLEWFSTNTNDWAGRANAPRASTARQGSFIAFLRPAPADIPDVDVIDGYVKVRVVVERGAARRATANNFQFLPDAPAARIAEGGAREQWVSLDWGTLTPVA